MRFLRNSLTGLFLLSVTLGLFVYAGFTVVSAINERLAQESKVPVRNERVFAVTVVEAREETIAPTLTAFGEVKSSRTLEIRAKASGTLVEIAAEFVEGGRVQAGQLLALVDPADAQSALDRAKSDLLDAEAEKREAARALVLARDELAAARAQSQLRDRAFVRQRDLEDRGVGTAATVETAELSAAQARQAVIASRQGLANAEARVDQATTQLRRAEIALAEAKRRLQDTRVVAGFSGTLSNVTAVQGGLVSNNEQLANLIDAKTLEVAFRVSTQQYARLLDESGSLRKMPVEITLDVFGEDLTYSGMISRDSAIVGEGQTGRLIYATLGFAPGLKPGDFVTVEIEEPPLKRMVRLPATSLGADGSILILDDTNRLTAMKVDLIRRQGDDILVFAEGLEGRTVVAERSPLLGAGIKVRPLQRQGQANAATPEMLELSQTRRARLVSFVETSTDLPEAVKSRLLGQLEQARVPASMVKRLERRMGG
ncbi:Macrolide export protein MacA [Roseovarius litorisediminis]|uniref:Macrolide export protein MacA n=1 Tax=Roseovarius litorisediminis TaxID=1312363 RepID=A0A1Y5TAC3_9RHOB|nr:HlyD family efflux transporter periplasmic adaptor subunit [Roseovarius litorisediminis]SLN59383.1 Macrolide export protein MacA [Roseovarius litorisediminis]